MDDPRPPLKIDPRQAARNGVLDLGAYIPGKPIHEVKEEYGLEDVVKLASNECQLPLPETLKKVLREEGENISRYPDGHCRRLRAKVAEHLQIPPECLLFGNGAEECVRLIGQAFLNPGETALIPSPMYDAYDTATRMPGAEVIKVPLRDYRIDLNALLEHVDERTKIIWLCSPANPAGTVIRRSELDRFLDRLPEGILVVFDEAYGEFVVSEDAAHALDYLFKDARVIGLRTFSKAFGLAGLRIGYVVGHPGVVEMIGLVKIPFNVNVLAQTAALCMLDERDFVKRHVEMIRQEREFMINSFEQRGLFVVRSETNFLFLEVPMDGDDLFRRLLPRGVIIRPGSIFGLPRFIRLTIGTREQNLRFLSELDSVLTGG